MSRASTWALLALMIATGPLEVQAQALLYCPGSTPSATRDDTAATYTGSDGAGPVFVCQNSATDGCLKMPGTCNVISESGGDIYFGKAGVCTANVHVGNLTLGNGTVSALNGAIIGTNSYLQFNGTSLITGLLLVSVTVDIASIPSQTCADVTATVAGVEANDGVFVTRNFASTANYSVSDAYVSNAATDTVTFRACNGTAGAVDPASGAYLFWVVRKS